MNTLYKAALRLMSCLTLEEVCEQSIREGCKITGAKYGSVYWWVRDRLVRVYTNSPIETHMPPRRNGNVYGTFETRKMKIMSIREVGKIHKSIIGTSSKTFILLPLYHSKKSLGTMTLHLDRDIEEVNVDREKMNVLSSLISLAIRNIQLSEQKEEAIRQRDLFMSLASHELKTPLAVIIATLQLYKRAEEKGKAPPSGWFSKFEHSAIRLRMLADEMFASNQLSAEKFVLNKREQSIPELVQKILSELRLIYTQKFRLINKLQGKNVIILIDPEKLAIVLTNIFGNAAKYSPSNKGVSILLKNESDGVLIQVKDHGEGIEEQDLKHIFDRFFQGKNKKSGLGLGLFLARKIIENHDGSIEIVSKKGKGTTVKIFLPFQTP